MNTRFLWLLFAFSVFTTVTFAQNSWLPGYIITLEGDTVHGELEMRELTAHTYGCSFRVADTHENITYSPSDIYGYRFHDGRFFISHAHDSIEGGKHLFFEFLVAGKVNFYHVRTTREQSRYFAETASKFHELKQTEMFITNASGTYLLDRKEYVGILKYMLQDAGMEHEISSISLTPKALIEVSMEYQERVCPDEDCIVYTREMERISFLWSLSAETTFQNHSFGKIVNSDTRFGLGFNARVEAVDFLPFNSNISALSGINVFFFNTHNLYAGKTNTNIIYNGDRIPLSTQGISTQPNTFAHNIDIQAVFIGIPLIFRYNFFSGKVQPFLSTGIETQLCISQNDKLDIPLFTKRFDQSIPDLHLGYLFSVGTRIRASAKQRILLEATYHRSQNMEMNQFYRFTLERFSFSLGYEF